MPEESIGTPSPQSPNDDAIRRLERRIESLEYAAKHENKWWRGGLIAALVLVALSILIAGHHRHHHPPPGVMMGPGMMGMRGWQGGERTPYGPPPPPNWGYRPGYGPQEGWHHQWNGPGPEGQPPSK